MYVVYGTFVKPSSIGGCLAVAEQALRAQNLIIAKGADGADFLVVGGDAVISVTIVAVPQPNGTWMVVSVSANDPNTAAQARDVIRGMIEGAFVP